MPLAASDARAEHAREVAAAAPDRVAPLDALRGVLALSVALYHLGVWTHAVAGVARSAVVIAGVYAPEGFFVISGFCFFHLYRDAGFDSRALRAFHVKRFFRIAPLYFFAILLGVAFSTDQSVGPKVDLPRVIENLTLTFGLFHPNHSMAIGGWSIGIEYVFYLAFPLLAYCARRPPLLLALTALFMLWAVPGTFGAIQSAAPLQQFHAYVRIPNHAFLFLLGAIAAELRRRVAWRLPAILTVAVLLGAWWIAVRAQPPFMEHVEVMVGMARVRYLALCAVSVLGIALISSSNEPQARALAWIGDASYSIYLMHPFAWFAIDELVAPAAPMLQVACGVCATLALAALTRATIERPLERVGRRLAT